MKISLIAAIGKNRELGRENKLLFQIPEDMKFFKEKTNGHAVIMGRKTYESIGRLLPNRFNIILSRQPLNFVIEPGDEKFAIVNNIEEALEIAREHESEEVFVIGGAQIYEQAIKFADKLYLTLVDDEVKDADVFFPDYARFKIVSERKSSDNHYAYDFIELAR